ncbi:unnamed protein product [Discosporangium mesarthrocarpum]
MAIAMEWDGQTGKNGIEPATMPLMSLAATALDQISLSPKTAVETCLKYLPTDTLCFLMENPDPALQRKQEQLWSPIREWSAKELGIPTVTTTAIFNRPQHPPEAASRAQALRVAVNPSTLAAIQGVAMDCKSLLIAMALAFGQVTPQKAFDAARLEEEYNVERWGMVEGGHDLDRSNTYLTVSAAATMLRLRAGTMPLSPPVLPPY